MHARPAVVKDMRNVFNSPAKRCLDEIECAGYTFAQAKEVFRARHKSGAAQALVFRDEVLAIIAWGPGEALGRPIIGTYFLAKEEFFTDEVPSVRFGRKFMRELQAHVGNLPLVSMCWGTHPEIERWYRLMGYRLAETFGRQRNFVLDPR